MPKNTKNKLESGLQIDGKLDTPKAKARTLAELFGDTGFNKYQTFELEEYEGRLKQMNKTDLQAHATQVGLLPHDNRQILIQRLLKEFKNHVAAVRKNPGIASTPPPSKKKINQDVLNILSYAK